MIIIDTKLCEGCGDCVASSPNDCMELARSGDWDAFAYWEPAVVRCDVNYCTQCGVCVWVCPNGAIALVAA